MTADFDGQRIDLAAEADFRLGQIVVRPSTRQVEINGQPETLEPRVMQVFVALARSQGRVVSRDELIRLCWEGRIVGDDALNRCVSRIRKLGDASGDFHLETIPRVGYRLRAAKLASPAAPALAAAGPEAVTGAASPDTSPRRLARLPAILMAAGLLAAATTGIAYWIVRQSRTLDVVLPMAIAVAKFEAPDGDAELQQFATAAARSVADGLTRAGQRVVPVNLAVESAPREMRAAAPNPDAQILVNGYVSREHGRIRIVARLDHAKRAFTVWSNTLEGRLSEPGVMGQRLSAQIISKLDLTGPANLLNSDDPRDVERARTWLLIIQRSDDGDDRGAMEGTKRLIEIWPDEAHAYYSRTIETMDALPILSLAERTIEFRAAREAAQRALELDRLHPQESTGPFSAVARATPAYAWGERIKGLEDAIATGRTVPPVGWLADNYLEVGRVADALAKMGAQPIYGKTPLVTRARVLLALGDRTRAERDLRDGRDLWPLHPVFPELLFEAAAWLGSPDEAAGRLTEADPWSPTTAQRTLLSLFVASGRSARSDQAASIESRCASQASRRDEATLLDCLSALTILERRDAAFAVVDILFPDIRPKAGEDPDARWLAAPASSWNPDILYMPWTASLRADPRIIPVFERLGLLDYWRTSGAWPDFCEIEPLSVCSRMKSS